MIEKTKQVDYGIAILKMIMCFMVVLCHFWNTDNITGVLVFAKEMREYAVSVFMMLAFMFAEKTLRNHEPSKVKNRFGRLLIPHLGWALIYWGVYFLLDAVAGTNLQSGIGDLFWQVLTGHSPHLNPAMWFQTILLLLTALFLFTITVFKNKHEYILCLLALTALAMEYSGGNMIFDTLRYELRYPLGRFVEMIPIAVAGYMMASKNVVAIVKKHRIISSGIALAVVILVLALPKNMQPQGYGYQGIKEIFMGIALICLFCAIPFDNANENSKTIISKVTRFTSGIYCMHFLVGTLFNGVASRLNVSFVTINSFFECIIIYLVCYFVSWIGTIVFGQTKLKALFN